jgi:hypothetical protein
MVPINNPYTAQARPAYEKKRTVLAKPVMCSWVTK